MLENEKVLNELEDEDLNEVAGGGTYTSDGYLKTTIGYSCQYFECPVCGTGVDKELQEMLPDHLKGFANNTCSNACANKKCKACKWHSTMRCNNPANMR